jgi:xanthine dehydrogenase accessory factor
MDTAALQFLADLPDGVAGALAVVVSVEGSSYRRRGALRVWALPVGPVAGTVSGGCLEEDLAERARRLLSAGSGGELVRYDLRSGEDDPWGLGAGCNGQIDVWLQLLPAGAPSAYRSAARWWAQGRRVEVTTVLPGGDQWAVTLDAPSWRVGTPREPVLGERLFVDRRAPAPLFLVFGRGADTAPVLALARQVGFRARQLGRGDDLPAVLREEVPFAAVAMSHHFPSDREAVRQLLAAGVGYVGVLGPRARTERILPPPWPPELHAPVGLDIGAEGPEEIALAIVGEALAVLRGASGGFLRAQGAGPAAARTPPDTAWAQAAGAGGG